MLCILCVHNTNAHLLHTEIGKRYTARLLLNPTYNIFLFCTIYYSNNEEWVRQACTQFTLHLQSSHSPHPHFSHFLSHFLSHSSLLVLLSPALLALLTLLASLSHMNCNKKAYTILIFCTLLEMGMQFIPT